MQEELTLNVESIKRETEKAWLTVFDNGDEVWLPKSQCKLKDNKISIPSWLARANNIEEDLDN